MSGTIAIIDADSIVYRIGFGTQWSVHQARTPPEEGGVLVAESKTKRDIKEILDQDSDLEYREVIYRESEESVIETLDSAIEGILDAVDLDHYRFLLSAGEQTHRHKLATLWPYKQNRKNTARPLSYDEIRYRLMHEWGAEVYTDVEADDAVAFWEGKDALLCGIDKDLLQIVGDHYNYVTGEFREVDPVQAKRHFMKSVLVGDASDNIPGVTCIGEKRAASIVASLADHELTDRNFKELFYDACRQSQGYVSKKKTIKPGALLFNADDNIVMFAGEGPSGHTIDDVYTELCMLHYLKRSVDDTRTTNLWIK